MSFTIEKETLQEKYKKHRQWLQSTPSYGCWVYPHAYYMELIDLVKRHCK